MTATASFLLNDAYSQLRIFPDKTEVEERITKLEAEVQERNSVIVELSTNGAHKADEMDRMKSEMESMKAQLETMSKLITSIYQGKAKPIVRQE